MTDIRFRLLMVVSLGLLVLSAAADLSVLHGRMAADPANALAWSTAASVGAGLSFAWLLLFGAGFVGMYLFKPWGRFISLAVAIAVPLLGTVSALAFGNTVDTMPSSVVAETSATLSLLAWGAVLALAYHSPLSLRFRPDPPSTTRLADGPE
jgi:hypothetical protein